MAKYIGETTEYDKKQEVERRKVKNWLKSVSAFANGSGGCLLFGIADDDTIIGLTDAKTDAEFISQKIKERIDPMPQIDLKNALAHRDYLIQGSEVHVDMYDDRMVIYSPGSMPEGRLIQTMNLEDIPSVRRNPVIADIFAQLGYMERKGSGMGKIINPIKALPYFEERMFPSFFSDRAQFTVTFPNMILAWQESHPNIEVNFVENEGDTQGDTQGGTQGKDLDKWIEYQVAVYPKITTGELAQLSGKSIITIKRRIAKMPHIVYVGSGYSGHWEVRKKE